jgi:hypothetical protein
MTFFLCISSEHDMPIFVIRNRSRSRLNGIYVMRALRAAKAACVPSEFAGMRFFRDVY